jgi:DNA-binding CsgD family transcriptional regulator
MIALASHCRPTALTTVQPESSELMTAVTGQFATFALDCLETAVFVLDRDARILFTSASARRLLEEGRLYVRNGQLCSPINGETATLRRVVRQCVEVSSIGPSQMAFHRLGDVEDALCLAVVAARRPGEARQDQPFVMVFASKPCEASLPDTQQLRSHFGLTYAQARLAIEIAKGQGLKVCTQRLGIAMSTGRSHLRQIFQKTETRRQAELVRVISACRFNVPETADSDQSGFAIQG